MKTITLERTIETDAPFFLSKWDIAEQISTWANGLTGKDAPGSAGYTVERILSLSLVSYADEGRSMVKATLVVQVLPNSDEAIPGPEQRSVAVVWQRRSSDLGGNVPFWYIVQEACDEPSWSDCSFDTVLSFSLTTYPSSHGDVLLHGVVVGLRPTDKVTKQDSDELILTYGPRVNSIERIEEWANALGESEESRGNTKSIQALALTPIFTIWGGFFWVVAAIVRVQHWNDAEILSSGQRSAGMGTMVLTQTSRRSVDPIEQWANRIPGSEVRPGYVAERILSLSLACYPGEYGLNVVAAALVEIRQKDEGVAEAIECKTEGRVPRAQRKKKST